MGARLHGNDSYSFAIVVGCGHKDVLTSAKGIEAIVKAVGEPVPRWDEKKVAAFRKATLGK